MKIWLERSSDFTFLLTGYACNVKLCLVQSRTVLYIVYMYYTHLGHESEIHLHEMPTVHGVRCYNIHSRNAVQNVSLKFLFEICKNLSLELYYMFMILGDLLVHKKNNEMKSHDISTNVPSISALCPCNRNSFNSGNWQGIHNSGYINLHVHVVSTKNPVFSLTHYFTVIAISCKSQVFITVVQKQVVHVTVSFHANT